ncbi:MAG TPA: flagellar basal body-associated protein FliL [Paraburkholderia sp.]|jgi:flagellar FliL protein|nr:flagellar basal body-associated protein FliL [Paraburkholderia sp.]
MATTTANPQAAAQPRSPGLIKRLLVILLIALAAAGIAGGGVWFYMSHHESAPAQAAQAKPAPAPVPVFFALDPMTVNLQSDDGEQHYLRIGLTLKLSDQQTQEHLSAHMPEIRSRVLLALSNKHPEELAPLDGKRALAKELATLIGQPTDAGGQPLHVEDVLFTEFVVQ